MHILCTQALILPVAAHQPHQMANDLGMMAETSPKRGTTSGTEKGPAFAPPPPL